MVRHQQIKQELKKIHDIRDAFIFVENFNFNNKETNEIMDQWKIGRL